MGLGRTQCITSSIHQHIHRFITNTYNCFSTDEDSVEKDDDEEKENKATEREVNTEEGEESQDREEL